MPRNAPWTSLSRSHGRSAIPLEYLENVANLDPENVNPPSFRLRKYRPEQPFQRTIYLPIIRSGRQPGPADLRNVFDFTQPAEFAGQRAITAVPTQALFLMNSPVAKQRARDLAERVRNESETTTARLEQLWMLVLNRPSTAAERDEAERFLKDVGQDAWAELCHALLASNEFLMRL